MKEHKTKFPKMNLPELHKTVQLPKRSIGTWNRMKEEVIMANNVQQLMERLNKYRY